MGVKDDGRKLWQRANEAARKGASALRVASSVAGSVVRGVLDAAADIAAARNAQKTGTKTSPSVPERSEAERPDVERSEASRGVSRAEKPSGRDERTDARRTGSPRWRGAGAGGSDLAGSRSEPSSFRPPTTDTSPEEPIQTRTLARLLAQQGHARRALAIYEALLAEVPDDDALRREMEELRSEAAHAPGVSEEMVSVAVDARTVWVSWQVSDTDVARASRLLGHPGKLAVRLAVTAPDATRIVRTETRELADVDPVGEWVVRDLPDGSRATAAVGVLGDGRFVSIAHHRAR